MDIWDNQEFEPIFQIIGREWKRYQSRQSVADWLFFLTEVLGVVGIIVVSQVVFSIHWIIGLSAAAVWGGVGCWIYERYHEQFLQMYRRNCGEDLLKLMKKKHYRLFSLVASYSPQMPIVDGGSPVSLPETIAEFVKAYDRQEGEWFQKAFAEVELVKESRVVSQKAKVDQLEQELEEAQELYTEARKETTRILPSKIQSQLETYESINLDKL